MIGRIVNYDLQIESTTESLAIEVYQHIQNGWQPLGGPFIDKDGNYCQALVIDEEGKKLEKQRELEEQREKERADRKAFNDATRKWIEFEEACEAGARYNANRFGHEH